MSTDLEELRAQLEEIKKFDLETLRSRVELFNTQINLEEEAQKLGKTLGIDPDLPLIVAKTAWMVFMGELSHNEAVSGDAFGESVRGCMVSVLEALHAGKQSTGDVHYDKVLARTKVFSRSGQKVQSTRGQIEHALTLVPKIR